MTPKKITDALEEALGHSGSVRQLRDAIEDVLLTRFGQPVTTSAELSEGLCHKVAEEVEARALAAEELGTITVVSLRNHREVVHGSLLVFPDDDPSTVSAKISRLQFQKIFVTMQSLSFDEFERFGRAVLRELGCPSPMVTKRSGDQGIDFYGEVSIGQLLDESVDTKRLLHSARTVMVGQAKHYPNRNIGPREVRELVGALSLARTSTYSEQGLDLLDRVDLRPNTPALAVLFSTGDFTSGARRLATEAGLALYSGLQLAVFLADCRVGMRDAGEESEFDEELFRAWLNGRA